MLAMPLAGAQPLQSLNPQPTQSNWFSDGLSTGLDLWGKYEQINAAKNASVEGRRQMDNTVQVESPQVIEVVKGTPAPKSMTAKFTDSIQENPLLLVGGVAAVGLLVWLSK